MPDLGPLDIKITATGISEVLSSFKNLEKSVERLQANMTNAVRQGSNRRKQQGQVEADSFLRDEVKKTKAIEKERSAREREYDKLFREIERQEQKSTRDAQSEATKRIRITEREAANRNRLMRSMVGNAGRVVSGAIRIGGAALTLGGGLALAGAFDQQKDLHQEATSLAVATNVPGGSHLQTQDIVNKANDLSKEYGINASELVKGQHAFAAVGGTPATNMLNSVAPAMAKISAAEGVDPAELGEAMGTALKQNPDLNAVQLVGLMRVLVEQGKESGIELKNLVPVLGTLLGSSALYSGDQTANQSKLASLAQFTRGSTGSAEQSATYVNQLTSLLKPMQQKGLAKYGVQSHDDKGFLLPIDKLFHNILEASKGSPLKIQEMIHGRSDLLRLFEPFVAIMKKNGGDVDAAMSGYTELITKQLTAEQLNVDAATRMNDPYKQLEIQLNKMKTEIGEALLPALEKLVPIILSDVIPAFKILASKIPGALDAVFKEFDSMSTFIKNNKPIFKFLGDTVYVLERALSALADVIYGYVDDKNPNTEGAKKGRAEFNTEQTERERLQNAVDDAKKKYQSQSSTDLIQNQSLKDAVTDAEYKKAEFDARVKHERDVKEQEQAGFTRTLSVPYSKLGPEDTLKRDSDIAYDLAAKRQADNAAFYDKNNIVTDLNTQATRALYDQMVIANGKNYTPRLRDMSTEPANPGPAGNLGLQGGVTNK